MNNLIIIASLFLICRAFSAEEAPSIDSVKFFRDEYVSKACSTVFSLRDEKIKNPNIRVDNLELAIVRASVSVCSYDETANTSIYFLNLLMNLDILFPDANQRKIFDSLAKETCITSSHSNLFILREYAKKWNLVNGIKDEDVKNAGHKVKVMAVQIFSIKAP
jgi:hypothetical protein